MNFPKIYLASQSPRRRELLSQIGVKFSVISAQVDETKLSDETAIEYVKRIATLKAKAGWDNLERKNKLPVLGADTSVVIDDIILGKPRNNDDARWMLQQLSGRTHKVMTAVAVENEGQAMCKLNISEVSFAKLSDTDIDWYLSTKEGVDKAGSYAVQGLAAIFITQIKGSYSGIMGLPVRETALILNELSA